MLLVRGVISHEAGKTSCEGWLDEIFRQFCGGEVSAAFGLELIAQTAAVHHGLRQLASGLEHTTATRGLLLGSRRLDLRCRVLPWAEPLRVTILDQGQGSGTNGMIRFEGRVEDGAGRTLAEGDATVLEWHPDARLD